MRAESGRIAVRYADLHARIDAERRRSLLEATAAADNGIRGHPVMLARLDRLSERVGRSPEIEQAKGILAERYGISRGEAFAILRSISSHSNRKLRDVAADLVTREATGGSATLTPSG